MPSSKALRAISGSPLDGLLDSLPKNMPADVPGVALPKNYGMSGAPEAVTVSQKTPRDFLDSLTDDPEQSQRIIDRIVERNQGVGRAVEDPALFQESVDRPYTTVSGDFDQDGAAGIWDANRRVVAYADPGDPDLDAGYNPGDINVRMHEDTHALLQPEPPTSMAHVDSLYGRDSALSGEFEPDLFDRLRANPETEQLLDAQNFPEFATNKRELVNLLFNVKRMSEMLDGKDYGVSRKASDGLVNRLMKSDVEYDLNADSYLDPDIDGRILDGYERQKDYLRELYRASNEYGRDYIRDLMHKLGMGAFFTTVLQGVDDPLGGLAGEQN